MKKEIGKVISINRKKLGLKQTYMAYKLGISSHAYANIENGRSDINTQKLMIIANLLGLKLNQLIFFAEEISEA